MQKKDKKKNVKRRKIKYARIFLVLIILFCFFYVGYYFVNQPISNIFITGNHYLTDQEIIDAGGLSNYPKTFTIPSSQIREKLKKNIYIKDVKVYKKYLKEVYITITENTPIIYIEKNKKTLLEDGKTVDKKFDVPVLTNDIPQNILSSFIDKMINIKSDVLRRISEIKYDPNVDTERFLLTMIDGNYVYVTLTTFDSINNYLDIIKNFPNKKGVLYLDAGSHFKVFDE
jgi:cell division septal protein FtsQ